MITCSQCSHMAGHLALVCPSCNSLLYARQLEELASRATAAEAAGDREALELWQKALLLLPPGTKQHGIILGRITALQKAGGRKVRQGRRRGRGWRGWVR